MSELAWPCVAVLGVFALLYLAERLFRVMGVLSFYDELEQRVLHLEKQADVDLGALAEHAEELAKLKKRVEAQDLGRLR